MLEEVSCQNQVLSGQEVAYEILKSIGCEMHMRHSCKYPDQRITSCLFETSQSACLTLVLNRVQLHTVIGQLALLGRQPLRREWEIWQNEIADKSTIRRTMLVKSRCDGF